MSRNPQARLSVRLSVLSAAVLLAGCSTTAQLLEGKKIDYKSASKEQTKSLEVPPDLTAPSRDERFAVPDINPKGSATFSSYAADRSGKPLIQGTGEVLPDVRNIRVERDGNVRWLVVPMAPEKLWPQIKEFWQDNGFIINLELPEAGIMETDWAENRAKLPQGMIREFLGKVLDNLYSTAERDKFRTRLERGAGGSTEIYVSERKMEEVFVSEGKDQTRWQPRAPDPGMEAEMLRRLMVRLGVDEARSKTLMAVTPPADRAALQRAPDGTGLLHMSESFDRAWRRVGLVLDRVGFTVEDRDRTKGLYFVRYVNPEADMASKKDDKGFLSKLTFWKSSKDDKAAKSQYRIYVKDVGQSGSTAQVLSAEGGVDNSESARKILDLLYQQLK